MSGDAASLERLNDISLPVTVPWWPLAPGWYVLSALLTLVCVWLAARAGKHWRANAYRREALRELAGAEDVVAIAELLRRTALVCVPRSVLARLSGAQWADWLDARCAGPMPAAVHAMLAEGIYVAPAASLDLRELHDYAARWIAAHRRLPGDLPAGH